MRTPFDSTELWARAVPATTGAARTAPFVGHALSPEMLEPTDDMEAAPATLRSAELVRDTTKCGTPS